MDVLFDIPVLGFILAFFAYLIDVILTTSLPIRPSRSRPRSHSGRSAA